MSLFALHARGQNAEVEPTPIPSENEEPQLPVAPEPELPSQEAQVITNANPVNENVRRFRYNFGVTVREVYDDNINISSTNRTGDFYTAIEPGIHLGFGDSTGEGFNQLAFDYIASAYFFADHSERNAVQHLIHLSAQHNFGHLSLGLSEDVRILDGTSLDTLSNTTGVQANTDVGGASQVNTYTTALTGSYDLTGKLFFSGAATYAISDYQTLISSQVFSSNLFLNYVYSPKLVVGLGGTGGVDSTDGPTPAQTFEQINARADYVVTGKISVSVSGGIEFRQFGGSSSGLSISPVFEISGSYHPFDATTITISGSRRTVSSAALAGQDYAETTISVGFTQRFLQRINFGLQGGYTNSAYLSATTGTASARTDDYFYVEPSVDVNVTRFWTAGLYYLYRQDSSTFTSFSFYDNQFGFRTALTF